jgi:hypothetical protein
MIDEELFPLVIAEYERAREKHGPFNYPFGTGSDALWTITEQVRALVDAKENVGTLTCSEVLLEETLEVLSEKDPAALKAELIQVASVALAWASRIEKAPARSFDNQPPPVPGRLHHKHRPFDSLPRTAANTIARTWDTLSVSEKDLLRRQGWKPDDRPGYAINDRAGMLKPIHQILDP